MNITWLHLQVKEKNTFNQFFVVYSETVQLQSRLMCTLHKLKMIDESFLL